MKKKSIRNSLQTNNKLNPFNQAFNMEDVQECVDNIDSSDKDDEYSKQIALSGEVYNSFYNEIMEYIKKKKAILHYTDQEIAKLLLAICNRDYFLLKQKIRPKQSVMTLQNITYSEIDSPMQHYGKMNVVSAIENQVDISNITLNIPSVSNDYDIKNSIYDDEKNVEIIRMYGAANLLYYIKDSYDTALWENGYIERDDSNLHIRYIDSSYPIAKKVGEIRSGNNMLATMDCISKITRLDKEISNDLFKNKRCKQVIDKVWMDEKYNIQYSFKNIVSDTEHEKAYVMAKTGIDLYYPFITTKKFSQLSDLSIDDLLILFTRLSLLVDNYFENLLQNAINDTNIRLFSLCFGRKEIIRYLKQSTIYSKKQIISFLDIITSEIGKTQRVNLWSRPLLKLQDSYYFLAANIVAPNYNYIVDEWLAIAGYNLDERGHEFEKYIKQELSKQLEKRHVNYYIPDKNKFYKDNNTYEEIDLIVNLKSVVIIAEVKCIKHPMNCRDSYNNMKTLRKAADQIKRKSQFIVDNSIELVNDVGDIKEKRVINVIVTNFPIYAGTEVNGIPVIDYYLFESYFRSGGLTHTVIDNTNRNVEKTTYTKQNYYNNENEMCNNLLQFIKNPMSIDEIRENLEVREQELTLPNSSVHIFQEFIFDKAL